MIKKLFVYFTYPFIIVLGHIYTHLTEIVVVNMSVQSTLSSLDAVFGKIPPLIIQNIKYLSYSEEKDEFTCVPCRKIIKKSYNSTQSTTINFEKHFLGNTHQGITISEDELITNLKSTFSDSIPPIVLMNTHTLGMKGEDYECAKCERYIKVSKTNISSTENNFSYHLLSVGHEKALEDYRSILSELYEMYGGIPSLILNHSHFLVKKGKHFKCTICNAQLQVHPNDTEETEKCFNRHLNSLKHIINAKQANAFSITPQLKLVYSVLPNYMLRSVEYISNNGSHFFCSLCNENIQFNKSNPYETKLNFKQHILSDSHEQKLNDRRNSEDDVFIRVQCLFEGLSEDVLENQKYLSVVEGDLYCVICEEIVCEYDNQDQTTEYLESHFDSDDHVNMVSTKSYVCSQTLEDLVEVFGAIPDDIQNNLQHIDYKGGKNFECALCEKIMQAKFDGNYDDNTSITENNFEKHLYSNKHRLKVNEYENITNELVESLNELLSVIPQYLMNNLDHLSYSEDNFECLLCNKEIAVDFGNKKYQITEQNFRNHFLSSAHIGMLKNEANLVMETSNKLEFIFNKVPNFIIANIHHIEVEGKNYRCTLCDALIMKGCADSTELKFREHLFGSRHKANSEKLEEDIGEAFHRLDESLIPEFILKNIDFLQTYDDDLFCVLCQQILFINEEDPQQTKQSLRCHMDSKRHQFYLKNM